MKRLIACLIAFVCLSSLCLAQGTNGGVLFASDFGAWSIPSQGPSLNFTPGSVCNVTSRAYQFIAPTVGTPIRILDSVIPADNETVTPTGVQVNSNNCSISATLQYTHSLFQAVSGTGGLQEALNYAAQNGYSLVVVTAGWTQLGGITSMLTAAKGSAAVSILDERTANLCSYEWSGSAYAQHSCLDSGGGGGSVTSVFTRTGAVTAQTGDYTVSQITGAAPIASPTFTGTVTDPALTLSGITGSTQCLHVNTLGVVSGTGADCGSGGSTGTVGSGTINQLARYSATGTTVIGDTALTDDLTTLSYSGAGGLALTGTSHGITIPAGTAVAGATGKVVYTSDSTNGYAEVNENNTGLARICTASNAQCTGSVSHYYTSSTSTGIGPTSFTPAYTMDFYDATATTGNTRVVVAEGAGQSTDPLDICSDNTCATEYFQFLQFGNMNMGGTMTKYDGAQTYDLGLATVPTNSLQPAPITANVTAVQWTNTIPYDTRVMIPTSCYATVITAGSGSMTFTMNWTDEGGAQSRTIGTLSLASKPAQIGLTFPMSVYQSAPVTYTTTGTWTGSVQLFCAALRNSI